MERRWIQWLMPSLWLVLIAAGMFAQSNAPGEKLPIRYEELTATNFLKAIEKSGGTCMIALGILEKHGPHLPLGTDMMDSREVALRAAAKEYTLVFPQYYVGQIFEAKHQPGTIAYSQPLMWQFLQETCDELARNGIRKIILVNGHGGNTSFLHYFGQAQLASRKDYAVYLFEPSNDPALEEKIKKLKKTNWGGHADEEETSSMLSYRPDLVHLDQAKTESGADLNRLSELHNAYTGIWWFARYPNHYAGDGSAASRELGNLILDSTSTQLAQMIGEVKRDTKVLELQKIFYDQAEKPTQRGEMGSILTGALGGKQ
jgi:creatinine amidohydrolase